MKAKELILTIILMLLSAIAGIFVYQNFFGEKPNTELKLDVTSEKVDTNNIDYAKLIAKNLAGTNIDLSQYQGKHLIINFWATWCPPCRKEIPLLIDVQEKYKNQNVQVLGIAMDDTTKVEKYMQSVGFNYPSLISDLNQTTRFAQQLNYEFIALPFTFFINQDGKLVYTKVGEIKEPELEKLLNQLLSES